MRKPIIYLLVFVTLLLAPTAVRYFSTYRAGSAARPEVPVYTPDVPAVPTPSASDFVDEPTAGGEGLVLLDVAHDNDFSADEIAYLDGRLAARGYELLPFNGGDLATALRPVDAYLVIAPLVAFDRDEIQAVTNFVQRGGRMLLIGDPTRYNVVFDEENFFAPPVLEDDELPLNSLANEFDIIYKGDYLYNTLENEGNFRNIILANGSLAEDRLTDGLDQVVFYGSHSLQVGSSAKALLTGDDNTWSSATDRPGGLVLAAVGGNGRVLALGDINFLTQPYYTVYDNGRFIAQIADFLTETDERSFILADFPYFFNNDISLVYLGAPDLGPQAFDEIISLQDKFRRVGQTLNLAAEPSSGSDTLYLGIYNDGAEIADLLDDAGLTLIIDPPILTAEELSALEEAATDEEPPAEDAETDGDSADAAAEESAPEKVARIIQSAAGRVQMSGTAVILLNESSGSRDVIVLAASQEGLANTVNRLLDLIPLNADYALSDCLLQDTLALCPSNVADEEVEAELVTGGAAEPPDSGDEDTADSGTGGDTGGDGDTAVDVDLDADNQGSIALDETVSATLEAGQSHAWTFSDGPGLFDIVVDGDLDIDAVLELYDPSGNFVASADNTFDDGEETLVELELEAGDYTIVVRDFFSDGGSYTLTVTGEQSAAAPPPEEGGAGGVTGLSILVYGDDEGEPLPDSVGYTDVDRFVELLAEGNEVTTWIWSEEGVITADALTDIDLLLWDSGDYFETDGFFAEDTAVIVEYLDNGGELLLVGASPGLFGGLLETTILSDIELTGDDPLLLNGLETGEIIALETAVSAVSLDSTMDDLSEGESAFFLRGPDSEAAGDLLGVAVEDVDTAQRSIFMLLPFRALPESLQTTILPNMLNWIFAES